MRPRSNTSRWLCQAAESSTARDRHKHSGNHKLQDSDSAAFRHFQISGFQRRTILQVGCEVSRWAVSTPYRTQNFLFVTNTRTGFRFWAFFHSKQPKVSITAPGDSWANSHQAHNAPKAASLFRFRMFLLADFRTLQQRT
jgi:hypothetical protein